MLEDFAEPKVALSPPPPPPAVVHIHIPVSSRPFLTAPAAARITAMPAVVT